MITYYFFPYLNVSPLGMFSEFPYQDVTKWENTSCFRGRTFRSIECIVDRMWCCPLQTL